MASVGSETSNNFLIVSDENGGVLDLFKFLVFNDGGSGAKFLETCGSLQEKLLGDDDGGGGGGEVTPDHRWVIVVSILVRKLIKVVGKPMQWSGYVVEFILNLLSLNGNFLGLMFRILQGNVEMPKRGSETFISAIGHLDGRVELLRMKKDDDFEKRSWQVEMGDRALMDLCMMSSKLAYENAEVVRNVVQLHWKMHFVGFYNCWNEYQKELDTQVFIMCDEAEDANLIVISFRGTEPFDADDWITDFDYSWYEIPNLGKVHMGFLEALGLGNRVKTSTFQMHLQAKSDAMVSDSDMGETTAYYVVRRKLKELLQQHKNAKFVVTGHSLGGALAILFPTVLVVQEEEEVLQRLLGVYTFGQPRVGNRELGRYVEAHLEARYLRVVYCNDLIPRLPYDNKTFLYKHFGICLYYNSLYIQKKVVEEPNRNYFGVVYLIPEYANAVWELMRSLLMECAYGPDYRESWESFVLRLAGLAIPGISAHNPLDYVNSVRIGRRTSQVDVLAHES
ncbi:triacylglycerol lipase OBL1 [Salvia miltiorrhiza]|uniref:triacylglycerol lipase OBL1 n=1 Tax=Salvia miltiorrhiza TaxID=226208 RepID=UPI0025AC7D95|nr:triacylglycerol lipase OBL1 [Salvia miltiorrhiza]